MGNHITKTKDSTTLLPNEIQDFQNVTSFDDEILIKLHNHYKRFSSIQTDDGVIDYQEFAELINKDNNMTKRIFNAVDINKDGVINFREFIKYISCFVNGNIDEKTSLSFKLFADDKVKLISKQQIVQLLLDILSVEDSKFVKSFFSKDDITNMIDKSFEEFGTDEICFKDYKKLIEKNPQILAWLQVDLEKIKKAKNYIKTTDKKVSCFGC